MVQLLLLGYLPLYGTVFVVGCERLVADIVHGDGVVQLRHKHRDVHDLFLQCQRLKYKT